MDVFLNDVNVVLFKEWILNQKSKDYELYSDSKDSNKIIIETSYCIGEVIFHPQNIIELSIENIVTKEILFYLHFQMTTMKHAIDLFNEMIESLISFKDHNNKKVLICCSSGFTSSYFTSKLNEALKVLSYDYSFQACSYTKLFDYAYSCDVIMLAPQISYLKKEISEKLKDKLVLNIPSAIFAQYNVGGLLSFINDEYIKFNKNNAIKNNDYLKNHVFLYQRNPLLCISIYESKNNICVLKTLIRHNDKLINELDKRSNFTLSDLINIIDTCLASYQFENIHISIPGYIKNHIISLCCLSDFNNFNLMSYLKNKYPDMNICIEPNLHCLVMGYNHMHSCKSAVYVYRSKDSINCSIMYENKLIKGHQYFEGLLNEMSFINYEYYTNFKFNDIKLIRCIVSIICLLSPEVIVFNEDMMHSVTVIKEELAHYIPQEYIPLLKKSKHDIEYLLLGQILSSNDKNNC